MDTRQKEIFENIHAEYYASTADEYARAYKEKYVFENVARFLDRKKSVMELACGQGEASAWLKRRDPLVEVTGCDISEAAALDYKSLHNRPCIVADLTKSLIHDEKYDAVIVMGGIHHLIDNLDIAFDNIRGLLNPGGRLIMAEPNADYFLNPIRRLWYKIDRSNFDSETEEALSYSGLFKSHGDGFKRIGVKYFGGPAYFLLTLNMFLRIPNGSKRFTAPLLMGAERIYDMLPGRLPFASFVACWERT